MPDSLVKLASTLEYGDIVSTVGLVGASIIVYYLRRHIRENDSKHQVSHDAIFGTSESKGLISSVTKIQQQIIEQERLNERFLKGAEKLTEALKGQNEINTELKVAVAILNSNTSFLSEWIKEQKKKEGRD